MILIAPHHPQYKQHDRHCYRKYGTLSSKIHRSSSVLFKVKEFIITSALSSPANLNSNHINAVLTSRSNCQIANEAAEQLVVVL
jgi:hypothetical protein